MADISSQEKELINQARQLSEDDLKKIIAQIKAINAL